MTDYIYLIVLLLSIALIALFSAIETAFASASAIRIKQLANSGNKKAIKTYYLVKDYSKVITAVLICNNIVNVLATAIATYLLVERHKEFGMILATVGMAVVIMIFGDLTPKLFAKANSENFAIATTPFVLVLIKIFSPLIKVAVNVQDRLIDDEERVTATEEELLQIVQTIEQEGVLDQDERELIESAINFDDKTVREVMKPVSDTIFVYDNATEKQILDTIQKHKYSRIPVVAYASLQVIGIIRERDILDFLINKQAIEISKLIHPIITVSQRTKISDLLERLQKKREHLAIVVENKANNNFVGIVTLEDILEELVGEIYDEYDDLPNNVIEIGHHTYEVRGSVPIKQFFDDYLDEEVPKTKARNFAAWIQELAVDKKVRINRQYEYENYIMKVLTMENERVASLELDVLSKNDEEKWED